MSKYISLTIAAGVLFVGAIYNNHLESYNKQRSIEISCIDENSALLKSNPDAFGSIYENERRWDRAYWSRYDKCVKDRNI